MPSTSRSTSVAVGCARHAAAEVRERRHDRVDVLALVVAEAAHDAQQARRQQPAVDRPVVGEDRRCARGRGPRRGSRRRRCWRRTRCGPPAAAGCSRRERPPRRGPRRRESSRRSCSAAISATLPSDEGRREPAPRRAPSRRIATCCGLVGDDRRGGRAQVALAELGQQVDVRGDRRVLELDREAQRVLLGAQAREVVGRLGPVRRPARLLDRGGEAGRRAPAPARRRAWRPAARRPRSTAGGGLVGGDGLELEVARAVQQLDVGVVGLVGQRWRRPATSCRPRRRRASATAGGTGGRHGEKAPARQRVAPRAAGHHQIVESRFSISSTGRV